MSLTTSSMATWWNFYHHRWCHWWHHWWRYSVAPSSAQNHYYFKKCPIQIHCSQIQWKDTKNVPRYVSGRYSIWYSHTLIEWNIHSSLTVSVYPAWPLLNECKSLSQSTFLSESPKAFGDQYWMWRDHLQAPDLPSKKQFEKLNT